MERGLSGLKAEQEEEALEPPSGAKEKKTEAGRADGAETEQAGTGPLLEDVPSPLPSYEEEFLDTASEKAGELKSPERILTPLEERENQRGGLERPGAPEAPGRVLTPLEVPEGRADGEETGAPEKLVRSRTPVLLRQMEQLERAAAISAGDVSLRRRAGAETSGNYPVSLPGTGAAVLPGAAIEAGMGQNAALAGALSADDARWAERADRVFRRDSRRYDGGFYLY